MSESGATARDAAEPTSIQARSVTDGKGLPGQCGTRRWTQDDDATLRRMASAGMSTAEIGTGLGRTRRAVGERMYLLGIKSETRRDWDSMDWGLIFEKAASGETEGDVARMLGVDRTYLSRQFKGRFGIPWAKVRAVYGEGRAQAAGERTSYAVVRTSVSIVGGNVGATVTVPLVNHGLDECEEFADEKNSLWDKSGATVRDRVVPVPCDFKDDPDGAVRHILKRELMAVEASMRRMLFDSPGRAAHPRG